MSVTETVSNRFRRAVDSSVAAVLESAMQGPLMVFEIGTVILFATLFIAYLARVKSFQRLSKVVSVVGGCLLIAVMSYNAGYVSRELDEAFANKFTANHQGAIVPPDQNLIPSGAVMDIAAIVIAAFLLKVFDRRRRRLFETA